MKALIPGVQTGVLVSEGVWDPRAATALSDLAHRARALQCEWINLDYKLFTPKMPAFFHTHGCQLAIWTVNDEAGLLQLARAGVDSLTTDRPELLRAFTHQVFLPEGRYRTERLRFRSRRGFDFLPT